MQAIDNEELVSESNNKRVRLTTHRIRYHNKNSKHSDCISIMLDQIGAIELTYKSNILVLIIGIITLPVVIGIVFILYYFFSRKHVISISSSNGCSINIETRGMKREMIEEFIDEVENYSFKLKRKLKV